MLAHDTGLNCVTVTQYIAPTALYQLGRTMDKAPKAIEAVQELAKKGVKVTEPIAKAIINHELVEHKTFESWVTTMAPRGLGMTLDDLLLIASGNKNCIDVIDDATQRGKGGANNPFGCKGNGINDNNIIIDSVPKETIKAPQGTSKRKALRKLRTESKKSPKVEALYQKVLADKISCHAAMIQAGFRKPSKTYIGTPIERAKKALKDCSKQEQQEFIEWLRSKGVLMIRGSLQDRYDIYVKQAKDLGFVEAGQPYGLGYNMDDLKLIVDGSKTVDEIAKNAKPMKEHGGDRKSDQGDDVTLKDSPIIRGTGGAKYLTARIARDHPEIHERMKAGEFKSVRQAAMKAGIESQR